MSTKTDNVEAERKQGMTSEQLGLLVVMVGVVFMAVGIYTTEKIFSFYFNIGLGMLVLGSCLFALFIWARGYELQHMPIPLPDVVKEMLRTGIVRKNQSIQEKSGYSPRPTYQVSRTAATQPLNVPQTQYQPAPVQPSPAPGFVGPQPFGAQAEPVTPAPSPVAPQPQPVPAPVTPAPVAPAPSVQPPEPKKPEPKKEQYVDVLEEADKEFESYIDKLIEE